MAEDVTYLLCLLRTMLILLARGRFFSGMENQVFLPMITTFCFPGTQKRPQVIHTDTLTSKTSSSTFSRQRVLEAGTRREEPETKI